MRGTANRCPGHAAAQIAHRNMARGDHFALVPLWLPSCNPFDCLTLSSSSSAISGCCPLTHTHVCHSVDPDSPISQERESYIIRNQEPGTVYRPKPPAAQFQPCRAILGPVSSQSCFKSLQNHEKTFPPSPMWRKLRVDLHPPHIAQVHGTKLCKMRHGARGQTPALQGGSRIGSVP